MNPQVGHLCVWQEKPRQDIVHIAQLIAGAVCDGGAFRLEVKVKRVYWKKKVST